MKSGVLLVNLGTPTSCRVSDVRRYLREFLSDPRVITLKQPWRFLLVNGIIAPFRSRQSAKAYKKIWLKQGSPLLVYQQQLQQALQQRLGENYVIESAMRYGEPNILAAIERLRQADCQQLLVFPVFPQYSSAATGSALEEVLDILARSDFFEKVHIINQFYDLDAYVQSWGQKIRGYWQSGQWQHVLLSYHGLPVNQLIHREKSFDRGRCRQGQACPAVSEGNRYCYRAQCYASSRAIAMAAGLNERCYDVCFQSRLGKLPWIEPYINIKIKELRDKGVEDLLVATPSFVVDCLETLEEIALRLKQSWLDLGGKTLQMTGCLNAEELWVDALAAYFQSQLG